MKVIRMAPDLTFVLDKKAFLKITKKIEMEPGYTSVFIDEINRAVINNQRGKMLEHVRPEPGCTVEYDDVRVQKVVSGPGFAVVSYRNGRVIDPNAVEKPLEPVVQPVPGIGPDDVKEPPKPELVIEVGDSTISLVREEAIKVTIPVADPVVPVPVEENACCGPECGCGGEVKKEEPSASPDKVSPE